MHVLTPRQYEIASLYAAGVRKAEIARRRGVLASGIDTTLSRIMRRLGTSDRRELAQALLQCTVNDWDGTLDRGWRGVRRGDPVRITGGYFKGRSGTYWKSASQRQLYIKVGGGMFALSAKFIEPIKEA